MRIIGTILAVLGGTFLYMSSMYQGPIRPMLGAELLLKLLNSTANLGLLGMVLAILGGCLVFMGTFKSLGKSLDGSLYNHENAMIKVIGNSVVTMVEGIMRIINSKAYEQGREDMRLDIIDDPSLLHVEPAPHTDAMPLQPASQMPPLRERASQRNGHLGAPHH